MLNGCSKRTLRLVTKLSVTEQNILVKLSTKMKKHKFADFKELEKKHEARMKKYRKIWKEKGCIHWVS